jgi:hypothetical protein
MAAGFLAVSGGCWEEIHYTPTAETAEATDTPEPSAVEGPSAPAPDDAAAAAEPSANDPPDAPPVLPPSGQDLFAADADAAATERLDAAEGDASPEPSDSILPTPAESPQTTAPPDAAPLTSPELATPTAPTPAERRLAWQAMSKWSLAAAIHAKGLPQSPEAPILEEARAAAAKLGLELPELPQTARPENLEAAVIEGLRGELGVGLRNTFANRFGEAEGAVADLALRSHLLLLTYSPRDADASLLAESLRKAGEASGLPAELWSPLVKLIEERGSFVDVRQAVFDLQRRVEAHLSEAVRAD